MFLLFQVSMILLHYIAFILSRGAVAEIVALSSLVLRDMISTIFYGVASFHAIVHLNLFFSVCATQRRIIKRMEEGE